MFAIDTLVYTVRRNPDKMAALLNEDLQNVLLNHDTTIRMF